MKVFIEPIGKLINEFSKLPGVGAKTAQRYAYKVINMTEEEALKLRGTPTDKDGKPLVTREPATVDELKEIYEILGGFYEQQSTNQGK